MKLNLLLAIGAAVILTVAARETRADDFDSAGVKIHYTVTGQGDPVILIHGLSSSAAMNWDLPGITAELARHYQVIAPDCRGHGLSGKPTGEDQYGVEMVNDVIRLMDHLHIAKARVVGYSLGGMIVMKLVVHHPDRVSSAVLGGMGWLKTNSPLDRFWAVAGTRGHDRDSVLADCFHGAANLAVTEDEVKAVKTPVTILVGDHDPCRRLYVEPLRTIRPDWPVHIIADAGHITCITKPEFKSKLAAALAAKP